MSGEFRTLREARQVLVTVARDCLRASEAEKPCPSLRQLWRKHLLTSSHSWVLCVCGALLVFGSLLGSRYEWSALVEGIIVLLIVAGNALLSAASERGLTRELGDKLRGICDRYDLESLSAVARAPAVEFAESMGTPADLKPMGDDCLFRGSGRVSIFPAFRDGIWQRVPSMLLVEGDIIALTAGDLTPCRVVPINFVGSSAGGPPSWTPTGDELPPKSQLALTRRADGAEASRAKLMPASSPQLLKLCGDVRYFRLMETPLRGFLAESLSQPGDEIGRETLLRRRIRMCLGQSHRLALAAALISFLTGLARMAVRAGPSSKTWDQWAYLLLVSPASTALCLLPLALPMGVALGEATVTARLLSYFDKLWFYHGDSKQEEVESGSGDDSNSKSSKDDDQSSLFDDFDPQERVALLSIVRPTVSVHSVFRYFQNICWAWMRRGIGGSLEGRRSISRLRVPLRQFRLIEQLGTVSMLCMLDEETVCEPHSVMEEVFILNPSGVSAGDSGADGSSSSMYTLLDLHMTVGDGKGMAWEGTDEPGLGFEDSQWWLRLPSLKPIGLACLLTEGCYSTGLHPKLPTVIDPRLAPTSKSKKQILKFLDEQGQKSKHWLSPDALLVEHLHAAAPLQALRTLAQEIGYSERDMLLFKERHRISVIHPTLAARAAIVDPHAQGQEESWRRGTIQPHVRAVIVEDRRTGSLQCLSEGNPPLLLGMCTDAWDGSAISPISPELRRSILHMYRTWTLEDLDVIAFAYAPVPHSARESLTGPDAAHKMDYLVYAESYEVTKSVHSSPAGAGGVATPMSPTDEDTSILSRLSREDSDSNRAQSLPPKPKPSSSSSFRAEEYTMTSDSQLEPSGELEARKGAVKMARSLSADKISFMDADSAEFLSSEVESLREEAELLMAEGGVAANDVKGDGGPTVEGRASTTPVSIRAESTPNSPSSHSAFDFGDELGLRRGRSRPRMKRGSSGTTKGGFSAIGGRHRPHRGSMPGGVDAAGSGDGMTTLTAKAFDNIWGLTHEQVFLGMAASSVGPLRTIPALIEEMSASGVRFVYFSPRNMRRSKALADKMGIETDWNCAISLRPLEEPNTPDPHRMKSSYADWDVKARMPHGTAAIREHIARVDNVPLLVSIFTDATSTTTREMLDIFKEHGETVLGFGTAYRCANGPLFKRANLALARDALPGGQVPRSLPIASQIKLSVMDLRFNASVVSLHTALRLHVLGDGSDCGQAAMTDLIRESRRLLHNCYQALAFAALAGVTLAVTLALSAAVPVSIPPRINGFGVIWFLCVVIPVLSLSLLATPPGKALLKSMPEKNDNEVALIPPRLLWYGLSWALLASLGALILQACIFGVFIVREDPELVQSCKGDSTSPPSWQDALWCPEFTSHVGPNSSIDIATAQASDLMLSELVLAVICMSAAMQHRMSGITAHPPWQSRVWLLFVLALAVLQIAYVWIGAAVRRSVDLLLATPWQSLLGGLAWAGVVVAAGEILKRRDARIHGRYLTLLRLEFNTRLGMHSPR